MRSRAKGVRSSCEVLASMVLWLCSRASIGSGFVEAMCQQRHFIVAIDHSSGI